MVDQLDKSQILSRHEETSSAKHLPSSLCFDPSNFLNICYLDIGEQFSDKQILQNLSAAAMAAGAPVDVKELPTSYVFVADVPGIKPSDVKVQVENDSILKISGERKREDANDFEVKYVRVERSSGKFMRKFNLPANANLEAISAACYDGCLTVVVPKIPPPESHRPKTFDVQVSSTSL